MTESTHIAMTSQASLALMKFLADLSRRLGVGKHVYVVGGAVRNFIIKRPIKDIDVVIDSVALKGKDSDWFAKEIDKAIPAKVNIATNQYGVALLHIVGDWYLGDENLKGEDIEIANARTESYADGGYTPEDVSKSTIEQDVQRREFTFNTLLWRLHDLANGPDKAEILDLSGCGLRDLQEGVMRCPSSPDKTFTDDPSRMIRAIKFLVKYGFKISPEVKQSIVKNKAKIKNIPPSHLSNMLINTFLREPTGKKALIEMNKLGLLDVIKEIAQSDKPFRESLGNWADREAKVEFIFDLMDMGLPSGKRLGFLDRYQMTRVREITVGLSSDAADTYVRALQQPGKVVDTRALMQEFGLSGKDVRQVGEMARRHLLTDPALVGDKRRLTQRVREELSGGKTASMVVKTAAELGDSTSGVGLFFRLPDELASQFPSLGDEDDSPVHVTFLYVGDVKGREDEFLQAVGFEVAANTRGPVQATLMPLNYFVHPAKGRRVALNRVRFSSDMAQLRDRIRVRLLDHDFDVQDGFPLIYQPHVTLQYMDDMDSVFEGTVPTGSWMVDDIEVWGMPEVHKVPLGRTAKTFKLDIGDPLLMGKYLNSPGRIESFGENDKGDPTVIVRKRPKGEGKGTKKEVKVFKVRHDQEQSERDKAEKQAKSFGSGKALKKYLRDHPNAERKNHTVTRSKTKGDGPKAIPKVKFRAKVKAAIKGAGSKVMSALKDEAGEWKLAGAGLKKLIKRENMEPEEKKQLIHTSVHLAMMTGLKVAIFAVVPPVAGYAVKQAVSTAAWRLMGKGLDSKFGKTAGAEAEFTALLEESLAQAVEEVLSNYEDESASKTAGDRVAARYMQAHMHSLVIDKDGTDIGKSVPMSSLAYLFNQSFADAVVASGETETVVEWGDLADRVAAKLAGVAWTAKRIHSLADELGISWDDDPEFMAFSKGITGKGHLDEMTPAELGTLAQALKSSGRVASKFQKKKEVPKAKGTGTTTVYEYSEGQIQHRNREKAKKIEKLRGSLGKLRSQVTTDLKAKDDKTRLCALAVGMMNDTYERVGNETSAKDGHFGVTGWQAKHVKFSGGKATISYVGKSGVSQTKTTSDAGLVSGLKKAMEGKSGTDPVFDIEAGDVNGYLKPHGITAKDIRGLHANREVQNRLKAIRSKGGTLPKDDKEKKAKLKKEFEQAVEEASKEVGHEASTLRSQYLVPGLEDAYLRDGSVKEKLDKQGRLNSALKRFLRKADELLAIFGWGESEMIGIGEDPNDTFGGGVMGYAWRQGRQWFSMEPNDKAPTPRNSKGDAVHGLRYPMRVATKDKGEKEKEEVERLQRPSPTKKPPRKDLRRERMKVDDPDMEGMGADDQKDLSLNYKRIAVRIAARYIREVIADEAKPKHKPGDVWPSDGGDGFSAMNKANPPVTRSDFGKEDKEKAEAYAKGTSSDPDEAEAEADKQKKDEARAKAKADKDQFETEVLNTLETAMDDGMDDSMAESIMDMVDSGELFKAFKESQKAMREALVDDGVTVDRMKESDKDPFKDVDTSDPQAVADALVQSRVNDKVLHDPSNIGGHPLSSEPLTGEQLAERSVSAMTQFRRVSPDLRAKVAEKAAAQLADLDPESPQAKELNAVIDGLHAAASLNDEPFEATGADGKLLREPLGDKTKIVLKEMARQGKAAMMFMPDSTKMYEAEGREVLRDALGHMSDPDLTELSKGTPWESLGDVLGGMGGLTLDPDVAELVRSVMRDMAVSDMTTTQGVAAAISRGRKADPKNPTGVFEQVKKELDAASTESVEVATSSFLECIMEGGDIDECREAADAALRSQSEALIEALDDMDDEVDPQTPAVAIARAIAEGADPKIADLPVQKAEPLAGDGSNQSQGTPEKDEATPDKDEAKEDEGKTRNEDGDEGQAKEDEDEDEGKTKENESEDKAKEEMAEKKKEKEEDKKPDKEWHSFLPKGDLAKDFDDIRDEILAGNPEMAALDKKTDELLERGLDLSEDDEKQLDEDLERLKAWWDEQNTEFVEYVKGQDGLSEKVERYNELLEKASDLEDDESDEFYELDAAMDSFFEGLKKSLGKSKKNDKAT